MAKRELIYKDEARRAVLRNSPALAWCIDNIKPVMVIEDNPASIIPSVNDYWIARIQYWPQDQIRLTIVRIEYIWKDGRVEFAIVGDDRIIVSDQCAQFELLEKIEMERYK